jgi:hypothetical protein
MKRRKRRKRLNFKNSPPWGKPWWNKNCPPTKKIAYRNSCKEVAKKPPYKNEKNDERVRPRKVLSIKKIPSPQKKTSLEREKSQTHWRRCETMWTCTLVMNNLIKRLILK